jgi:hypothetical protein
MQWFSIYFEVVQSFGAHLKHQFAYMPRIAKKKARSEKAPAFQGKAERPKQERTP